MCAGNHLPLGYIWGKRRPCRAGVERAEAFAPIHDRAMKNPFEKRTSKGPKASRLLEIDAWIDSSLYEAQFAAACGAQYGIACANGTVAMHLALATLGLQPGD